MSTSSPSTITNRRWRYAAQANDKRLLGLTLGDIGLTYYELGDFSRALDYLNQALAISEELGDRRTKSIRLHGSRPALGKNRRNREGARGADAIAGPGARCR